MDPRQWKLQRERLQHDFTKALDNFQRAQRSAAQKEKDAIKKYKNQGVRTEQFEEMFGSLMFCQFSAVTSGGEQPDRHRGRRGPEPESDPGHARGGAEHPAARAEGERRQAARGGHHGRQPDIQGPRQLGS